VKAKMNNLLSFTPQRLINGYRNYQSRIIPLIQQAKDKSIHFAFQIKTVCDRYPPVKTFIYAMAGSSMVPVVMFYSYSTACLFGIVTVAACFQGGMVLIGSFFLFWSLACALAVATVITFWFSIGYNIINLSHHVDKKMEQKYL